MRNSLEYYLDFVIPEYKLAAIRTRCRCVDAMQIVKDKRIKRTLKKICKT